VRVSSTEAAGAVWECVGLLGELISLKLTQRKPASYDGGVRVRFHS